MNFLGGGACVRVGCVRWGAGSCLRRNDGSGGGGGVQVLFFSGCSGVIREASLSGRGAWRCSGLFGFVQVCSGCAGVERGVDSVNFCQPGVNLCQVLVACGERVVDGEDGGAAALWGEGHGVALLFWCERSRIWGEWGCAVGSCLRIHAPSASHLPPSPIHPSPLLGGRLGGGWEAASVRRAGACAPIAPPVSPLPPFLRPSPSFLLLFRHSCAGRNGG